MEYTGNTHCDHLIRYTCQTVDLVSQKLLMSWDFYAQQSLEFTENGAKKNEIKTPSERQFCEQKCLERGEWADWFKLTGRQSNSNALLMRGGEWVDWFKITGKAK